ncbi:MAG TPA: gamma-glutamyl-phosphate reductase, partial [Flavisolibacter sp.]|nr:gamma-glutamyl-phosphate reductase [Flavisolibacter sp.]
MNNVDRLIKATYESSFPLQAADDRLVKKTLLRIAGLLEENKDRVIKANQKDLSRQDPNDPKTDRLLLNETRIKNIAAAIRNIASLPCPAG